MQETLNEYLSYTREQLHQIPELGFDLYKTQAFLRHELEAMGYACEVIAHTGLVAKKAGKDSRALAFRADMDGLPIVEKTYTRYASKHAGRMHACGHDGHMSIVLGFAKMLSDKDLNKTVVFIFQPAEEGPGGAKVVVDEGVLTRYNVESIFGVHLYPELEAGKIGLVRGAMMAQNGEFELTIRGVSAHGAQPHLGSDVMLALAHLITQYHSVVSRNIDPLKAGVLTLGTCTSGEASNVIARKARLSGTLRAFDPVVYETLKSRIEHINVGIETSFNVRVDNHLIDHYPAVVNDDSLYETMHAMLDEDERVDLAPMMFAEDFAFYQRAVPGLFFMLGVRDEHAGHIAPLHSPYFDFNPLVLSKGVEVFMRLAKTFKVF